ncbi:uncharacterized protein LOC111285220 isoform X2 [Durio zibethinus]|uniref:Uncharacterized protein LOC111285220 isoform X2 n=1 Tax=Durio zibethinus TaxID=66656 RepID=A0A6P5XQ28_DURZI|nr:uncharacterized protein LOC111285220 isoform X2 [Durio zibethinus]
MEIIGDALRQAFMPKHEYESLREEDKALTRLQRPILIGSIGIICLAIFVCTIISLEIVFPRDVLKRLFCDDQRLQPLPLNVKGGGAGGSDLLPGAFYLTDQETVDYYWMVVFIPSMVIFLASVAYLVAGITVAYSAPTRHGCLKVVENNYCASKRGTAIFLRRRAAIILDEVEFGSRNLGLEMLEANPSEVNPDVERRVNEGFKAWMGSSLLSSDEEDEP